MAHSEQRNRHSDKVMSEVEAAYVAGLVDGEGTIGIRHQVGFRRKEHNGTPQVKIANTNLALLEKVVDICGNGGIYSKPLQKAGQKQCYDWMLSANQIRHVLPQVLSYLIAKRPQAELALEFLGLIEGNQGIAEANVDRAIAIKRELEQLNYRGSTEGVEFSKPLCSTHGCSQRRYNDEDYCYTHWLENRPEQKGVCENCGKEMDIVLSHKRFCSEKCQTQFWHREIQKPKLEAEKQARQDKACLQCGTMFSITRYKRKNFCSEACQRKYYRIHKE